MFKINEKVAVKKIRYDFRLSIQASLQVDLLAQAYNMNQSAIFDMVVNDFCQNDLKFKYAQKAKKPQTTPLIQMSLF